MEIAEAIRKEASRRKYSDRTIETYQKCVERFFRYCGKEPKEVSKKDVKEFLEKLDDSGKSGGTIHIYLNSLKFFFEDVLRRNMQIDIRYSRRPEKLPRVLTKEEVKRLIGKISNWKHRLMIELLYGSGLRVSELINIKVKDLNIEKNFGFVRQGKGNRDRMFILPKIVKEKIKNLIEIEKIEGEDNLFLSNKKEKYNVRTIQEIVKKSAKLAGLDYREIHCHTLRHSFATHLIENNYSVSEVQSLLGHKSPETTMVYLHTSNSQMINIKSPLDNF